MNHRLIAKPGEAVGQFEPVNNTSARIGGMRQDGNSRKPGAGGHATASTAMWDGGPAPINGFLCEIPDRFGSDAVADGKAAAMCDGADIGGGDPARHEAGRHLGDGLRFDGEQIAEARKCQQPALERDAVGLRNRLKVDVDADAGAFGKHGRGADNAALADILGGAGQACFRDQRQQFQVTSQAGMRRIGRGFPVRKGSR